jgi:hypothetical protein
VLHIYPDVYDRRTNTPSRLRAELRAAGVEASALDDETIRQMFESVTRRTRFLVDVSSIEAGRAFADGRTLPLLGNPARPRPTTRRRRAAAGR